MSGADPAGLLHVLRTDPDAFDAIWYEYFTPDSMDAQSELDAAIAASRGRL